MNKEYCDICSKNHLVETHHIVKRGQAKYLEKCKLNLIDLCYEHHRGTKGVHGKCGSKLDHELKEQFQNDLKLLFGSDIYYTVDQIADKLDISLKDANGLVKFILPNIDKYKGEDIIRSCMGGKLVLGGID
ncbi:hypothetical protein [Clostridium sardiniense]|uniref:hypothetical protein n=1 Tax=Clostridium sardiniense TaxID=29369 RepID=UPI00195BEB1D|nr:hypothetical protein [Clostridium sardiniense]MBM7835923.1 hypothetical protein [Clostridium sardiniense]